MQLKSPPDRPVSWTDVPTPDVWWGEDGIDALIWADPAPYDAPTPGVPIDGASLATEAAP
jgi:hypothetical protein